MSESIVVLRLGSHRSNAKLSAVLGRDYPTYWVDLWTPGYFALCPASKLADARRIKGITAARGIKPEDLRICWKPEPRTVNNQEPSHA